MVVYEAARAICNLPGVEMNDLSPAITVLQLFLSSAKPALKFGTMRTLSEVAAKYPMSIMKCNADMEALISDPNRYVLETCKIVDVGFCSLDCTVGTR